MHLLVVAVVVALHSQRKLHWHRRLQFQSLAVWGFRRSGFHNLGAAAAVLLLRAVCPAQQLHHLRPAASRYMVGEWLTSGNNTVCVQITLVVLCAPPRHTICTILSVYVNSR